MRMPCQLHSSNMSRNQNRKGGTKRGRPDDWKADSRDLSTLSNKSFEAYYKGNVVSDEEWDTFMECMRTSLPTAFRVHRNDRHSSAIQAFLEARLSTVFDVTRIPFYPQQRAVQCGVSRGDLKRHEDNKTIQKIVTAFNEGGYITRQEVVSMLPPLLLQVAPGHRVLDMCAAPGSKTSQILEMLVPDPDRGVLVANDMNASRLDILNHQTRRISGAHRHLIISNFDATRFPVLRSEDKFDRVLCDVVCSGDGTLRKSMDMWPRWNTCQGADLHNVQCRILMRGMALCKQGGIVVYSTCSLNPVEDEAVVSECLRRSNGAFRLMDPEPLLPGLQASPGRLDWTITTKDLSTVLHSHEEARAYMAAHEGKVFQYKASMFPVREDLEKQNIAYTRRVFPHQQDTGGFFVAAFECVSELPDKVTDMDEKEAEVQLQRVPAEAHKAIQTALSLPDHFPFHNLVYRSVSARTQKYYLANEAVIDLGIKLGSRVKHVGSKVFEAFVKYSNDKLRFSEDGTDTLQEILPESFFVDADAQLFLDLAGEKPMTISEFAARTGKAVEELPSPSFLLRCTLSPEGPLVAAAEKSAKFGKILAIIPQWQVTLCKVSLGLSLIEEASQSVSV
ncbi:tRNA (cytosine34-C5)-methyltransferase [Strigomonas culicis]|uniref:tRNA (Cytosine34-C5)-methyltransferase n=1 Tax=Strigomonas culicis TaxID=28005 RepID=S9UW76_9TRYP|nr:tRNA (cytosine34-C5)-methyltransferase [Strigomonas culicis]EPY33118.1 tRNA (cytosine34-C5)-methyltransferase [Strigomonas culicis]|eukprot:EPY20562.1 tRNA (cytosine34-C5)-methyltransferase [Strigomonas culicis]